MAPVGKRDVEKAFIKDIAEHEMKVMHDDGSYRHIRFRKPDSNAYWFGLVTWPGHLTIEGDMGCWTFSRTPDMFEFFRNDELGINPGYWAEKLQNYSKYEGPEKQFCIDTLRESMKNYLDQVFKGDPDEWPEEKQESLWEEIEADILSLDHEHSVYQAVSSFEHDGFRFEDWYESFSCKNWSYHYLWCLFAIVWGIQQYDKKQPAKEAA